MWGVDHGGAAILVAQKFLHLAGVEAIGQEVRRERMPEGAAGDPFGQPSPHAACVMALWTSDS